MKHIDTIVSTPPKKLRREDRAPQQSDRSAAFAAITNTDIIDRARQDTLPPPSSSPSATRDSSPTRDPPHSSPSTHTEPSSSYSSRKRKSSSPTRESSNRSKKSKPLPPANTIEAKLKDGMASSKTYRISDYEAPASSRLLIAVSEFECRVQGEDPFPDAKTQVKWAVAIWTRIDKEYDDRMLLSERMMTVVSVCFSHSSTLY